MNSEGFPAPYDPPPWKQERWVMVDGPSESRWRKAAALQPSGSIDEIVLSYVVSILEDLGSESSVEEAFDVEGFCEMMAAYFPEFSTIHHASVCQWMFELEASMSQKKRKDGNGSLLGKDLSQLAMLPLAATTPRSHTNSECSSDGPTKRVHQLSETSDGSSDSSGDYYYSGHENSVSQIGKPAETIKVPLVNVILNRYRTRTRQGETMHS
uniref:Uncharacterized protein n=1 Tax=Timema monikensis TaxID=170555 RepID=A0A7R9E0A9_9NEOP|nr:unnamed protein product [Timema monikensis]